MSPQRNSLKLSHAIEGMILEKRADGKSLNTISNYRVAFKKLQLFLGDDPPLRSVTREQLVAFFAWLRDDYISEPDGVAPRGQIKLSGKTRRNIHTDLSALWTWAVAGGHVDRNIIRSISAPSFEDPVIIPLAREEIEALLKACEHTAVSSHRPTAERDRLIVRLLLDTGIRAQELCDITIGDLNLAANTIKVTGKGRKQRIVYFGRRTAKSLWVYLAPRITTAKPTNPLILVEDRNDPRPMTRNVLGHLLRRMGRRAGIANVHPHRFRHTFATNYLRNGGMESVLQDLLGHSDPEMVRRYAHLVESDRAADHAQASPVDNWRL